MVSLSNTRESTAHLISAEESGYSELGIPDLPIGVWYFVAEQGFIGAAILKIPADKRELKFPAWKPDSLRFQLDPRQDY